MAISIVSKTRWLVSSGLTAMLALAGCLEPPADLVPSSRKDPPPPLSTLVGPEGAPVDYTIEAGQSFSIDKSYSLGTLTIHGKLHCRSDITAPITITARSIVVDGPDALFECGASEAERFHGQISFLLADDPAAAGDHAGHSHGGAPATLSVSNGGTLRMYGDRVENFGWQRIGADVPAKSSTVTLEAPAKWKKGDRIALGPSGFDFAEAEEREIASVSADGRSVTVTSPFDFEHRAFTKLYTEGNRRAILDERPEVANLTRNIVVTVASAPETAYTTKRGVQIVIHRGGYGYVDGIEIARGGKLGVLAEYPFHWHLGGDVPGQFLRNSSIHHSYQRCVTIHGTNRAEVSNGCGSFPAKWNGTKSVT